jgi:hypothetical protein
VYKTSQRAAVTVTWDTAAGCSGHATRSNSVRDQSGRLWGFQQGVSCAFKGDATHKQVDLPGEPVITWAYAPACTQDPDARNSVRSEQGQLWGWEQGRSCAFRINNGKPSATWALAPRCTGERLLQGAGRVACLSNPHAAFLLRSLAHTRCGAW